MGVIRSGVFALGVLLLCGFAARAADPEWAVAGEWVDTCNCKNPCPCWTGAKPTLKDCDDLYFFHIAKGHFGEVPLDGVDLIGVALSPRGKSMDQAGKDKSFVLANLYVSDQLTAAQVSAMEKLFVEHVALVPPDASKKHAFKKVALTASFDARGARASIPKILELDVRRTGTPFGQDTSAAPFSGKGVEGTQVRDQFKDDGTSWKLKGRNASIASFDWSSQKEAAAAAAAAAPAAAAPAAAAPTANVPAAATPAATAPAPAANPAPAEKK